jgi:BlaI family penicillinase repressor
MDNKITFTDREADIMQVLWDSGPSIVSEVRERLADPLAYTTVLTVLRTLETKGYVGYDEEGRGHRYFAVVKQKVARKSALKHLTDKLFNGSTELLFAQLVSDKKLSAAQVKRMRQMLDGDTQPDKEN